MDLELKDKVIIVTGGAKGIGEGIVEVLAREGALPAIVGRNKYDNEAALEKIGNRGFQVVAELTRPEDCKLAVEKVITHFGRVDGLVNNAGVNDGVNLELARGEILGVVGGFQSPVECSPSAVPRAT